MFKENAVILVTGGAAGIGRATALSFARQNCRVAISDLDTERGESAAREIRESGGEAIFIPSDVSDPEAVLELHKTVISRFECLDAACNNAGIEGEQGNIADSSLDNFDRVIGINLRGLYLCLRQQLRIMERQQNGAIVNMASVAGLVGFPGLPAYCASKGGVVQLTRTAAWWRGDKIIYFGAFRYLLKLKFKKR